MVSAEKLGNLLDRTKTVIAHQKEVAELRGGTFNVFSILKMERLENSTHSAFITELLNPHGSHLKGNIFLKLFLETLDEISLKLDLATANAKPEYHVGTRDVDSKTGGRIDIYISDDFNNCISIENKIDAGDQEAQIERYCNHNKGKNTVLYLTLHGSEPSIGSKGALESGADFYNISYRKHILEWLDKCLKEAADSPILRETIKQYKILIQKLTATMAEKETKHLQDIMMLHFKESEYFAANFNRLNLSLKDQLRLRVCNGLRERLHDKYTVSLGDRIDKHFSQIWIRFKEPSINQFGFGVESFSGQGHYGGAIMTGIFNFNGDKEVAAKYHEGPVNDHLSNWYFKSLLLPKFEDYELKLNYPEILQKLHLDNTFTKGLIKHILDNVEEFILQEEQPLLAFLDKI